ncbi:MAG: PhzF family phenazine biosynthesis protein [Desertifilum sp.]|nr:PhzF family phenazine biosynthesis protein [Desertifilum sp.]MDI9636038.1 PhzF family phenazine biosynthesis protein [Geitlerinema splendidum]
MAIKLPYAVVDVFAIDKYTGNQLAVFTDASGLSDTQMQAIAKEINYSETTFITAQQPEKGGYNVRIFTPAAELPFAGHPTLGTAYIIRQLMLQSGTQQVNLNLKVGQIPVTFSAQTNGEEIVWMRQNPPSFEPPLDAKVLAEVLQISPDEIDSNYPVQSVSTGVPFIIVPLKTLAALKACRVNREKLFPLVETMAAKSILVFSPETYLPENQLSVRVFADYLGIAEDPATGSANGCLAGYLVQHAYFAQSEIEVAVEQGYEIQRPSLLLLKAGKREEGIEVNVGGRVILIARGEFL